ncbi:hypothetical protein LTR94_029003, partial [Friedmanniomyces endolithicus]
MPGALGEAPGATHRGRGDGVPAFDLFRLGAAATDHDRCGHGQKDEIDKGEADVLAEGVDDQHGALKRQEACRRRQKKGPADPPRDERRKNAQGQDQLNHPQAANSVFRRDSRPAHRGDEI